MVGQIKTKLKISGYVQKSVLNNILKVPWYPLSASCWNSTLFSCGVTNRYRPTSVSRQKCSHYTHGKHARQRVLCSVYFVLCGSLRHTSALMFILVIYKVSVNTGSEKKYRLINPKVRICGFNELHIGLPKTGNVWSVVVREYLHFRTV